MADKSSVSDFRCPICLELVIEPVVMPCEHELCRNCFRHNVEEGNFLCPICRKRIASWARKSKREGTLVNQTRWNLIQRLFPEKCRKRIKGEADESEDELVPMPKRVFAKSGELREEYEKEMNKILEVREKEQKASEQLIKNILEEDKALLFKQESQQREDERLAREIAENIEDTQTKHSQNRDKKVSRANSFTRVSTSPDTSSEKPTVVKNKKKAALKSTSPRTSCTLERYFTSMGKETGSSSSELNPPSHRIYSIDDDLELAKALQKEYDKEAKALNRRDEYMLRKPIHEQRTLNTDENSHASAVITISDAGIDSWSVC